MKPEQEERLQEIEDRANAGLGRKAWADLLDWALQAAIKDIPWLIERLREAEADAPIPHCKISKLHPGDTIVFKCPGHLSMSAVENMKKMAAAVFGSEYSAVVLDGGLDLEIVRPVPTMGLSVIEYHRQRLREAEAQLEAEADTPGKGK